LPILSQDSRDKSRDVWCAKDKAATWVAWIVDGKAPKKAECDIAAIERNLALGRNMRITGTPTIFLTDGTRIGGYRSAEDLEDALQVAATATKK